MVQGSFHLKALVNQGAEGTIGPKVLLQSLLRRGLFGLELSQLAVGSPVPAAGFCGLTNDRVIRVDGDACRGTAEDLPNSGRRAAA